MRPISVTQTGVGTILIPLDIYQNPINVELDGVATGTVTWEVDLTNDDPFGSTPPSHWITGTAQQGIAPQTNTSAQGSVTVPARAIRLNVTAGTGSVNLRVNQAGTLN